MRKKEKKTSVGCLVVKLINCEGKKRGKWEGYSGFHGCLMVWLYFLQKEVRQALVR